MNAICSKKTTPGCATSAELPPEPDPPPVTADSAPIVSRFNELAALLFATAANAVAPPPEAATTPLGPIITPGAGVYTIRDLVSKELTRVPCKIAIRITCGEDLSPKVCRIMCGNSGCRFAAADDEPEKDAPEEDDEEEESSVGWCKAS